MHIRPRLFISYLTITIISILSVSILFFINAKNALEKEEIKKLEAIADLKVNMIESIFSELKQDIATIQDFSTVRLNLPILIRYQNDTGNPAFTKAAAALYDQLKVIVKNQGFLDMRFADLEGRTVYGIDKKQFESERGSVVPYFSKEIINGWQKTIWISPIFKHEGQFAMLMIAPSYDPEGNAVGFIALEVKVETIYNVTQSTAGLGQTGETLIGEKVGNEVTFLSKLRYGKEEPLVKKIPLTTTTTTGFPILQAVQGKNGAGIALDYRGEKVVAAWRYIPYLNWGLVAKIDAREAFARIERLKGLTFLATLIILVLMTLVSFLTAKSISGPIRKLHEGTEIIGRGNLDYRVEIKAKDEVGQLSQSFNRMVQNLKETTASRNELDREINERKIVDEALRKTNEELVRSNELNAALIKTIPFGMDIVDEKGNILFISDGLRAAVGGVVNGKKCWELYRDDKTQCMDCPLSEGVRLGQTASIETGRSFGGKTFQISHTGMIYEGKPAVLEIFQDITKRKQGEQELRDSEARFKTMFDDNMDGILLADTETKKLQMGNKAICDMLGYADEEIKRLSVNDIHPEKDLPTVIEAFESQARGEKKLIENLPVKRKDGSVFYADINASMITVGGKKYLMGSFRDITERKQLSAQRDNFLNMVSHELRTPLGAIKESVSLVSEGNVGPVNEKQKDMIDIAKRNVDRLTRLIDEVLDLQKIDAGMMKLQPGEDDINGLIREVHMAMLSLAARKGLEISLQLDDTLPRIKLDRDKIIQVLTNLINNAIKFTEKGGITMSSGREDGLIRVSVKDTGPGIKAEDMPKLFQRFSQLERKPGGTGLGLAISKEIIDLHNGKIIAESPPAGEAGKFGKGTTFSFFLPI